MSLFTSHNNSICKCQSVPVTGPVVAQGMGRGIALVFHDRDTRRGECSAARPGRTLLPGKDPVPIVQEAGWAPGPVWTGGKSRPTGIRSPNRPARSSVAIPTELPGPQFVRALTKLIKATLASSCLSVRPQGRFFKIFFFFPKICPENSGSITI